MRIKSYPDMEIYREQWAANKSRGEGGVGGMRVFLTAPTVLLREEGGAERSSR